MTDRPRLNIWKIALVIFIAAIFYFVGFLQGHRNLVWEAGFQPKIVNLELSKPKEVDFSLFWDVWKKVEEKYVSSSDRQKMLYGAIAGAVASLKDPYSAFLEPGASKRLLEDISGEFSGIGAEITERNQRLLIIAPLEDSPAQKVGLRSQDEILKIDDTDTMELSLDEAIEKIRGKPGTEVTLLIDRKGFEKPREFKIKRAKIQIKSVRLEFKDNNIAYLKVIQFGTDTLKLTKEAADQIVERKPKAVIIDLRNNPGGLLDQAIDFSGLFLGDKVIAWQEYRDGHREELKSKVMPTLSSIRVIVLINEGSASGSEIVAGAIRDHKRGLLLGQKTFGKGSVQNLEELAGGAALRLTVAKWLTPEGHQINGQGIAPDQEIKEKEEDLQAGRDSVLEQALIEARK